DAQKFLDYHSSFRAQHGASKMNWNADMAAKAQGWVNQCKHGHSDPFLGYGENAAEGAGGGYDIVSAMNSWASEKDKYSVDNPGGALHFTQMVWKASTDLGCAVAKCDKLYPPEFGVADVVVCEYYPRGNMAGAYA
ncbi:CAP domain-containing protein, partial [Crepidotus variabilis]